MATYFTDVEMQAIARSLAVEYNKYNPPKRVEFLEAHLIKCLDRYGSAFAVI